eukprot:g27013.t1
MSLARVALFRNFGDDKTIKPVPSHLFRAAEEALNTDVPVLLERAQASASPALLMAPENTLRHDVRLDALPSCLAAAKVQLHLLESAILKTEQELEASRAKACKSLCHSPVTPVQVVCIDEEWGSPWAATLAQTSTKLCGFREARHRLLNRMRELSLEDPRALADELLVQTSDVEDWPLAEYCRTQHELRKDWPRIPR